MEVLQNVPEGSEGTSKDNLEATLGTNLVKVRRARTDTRLGLSFPWTCSRLCQAACAPFVALCSPILKRVGHSAEKLCAQRHQ